MVVVTTRGGGDDSPSMVQLYIGSMSAARELGTWKEKKIECSMRSVLNAGQKTPTCCCSWGRRGAS